MARLYINTSRASASGTRLATNVASISSVVKKASDDSTVQTFTAGDVTADVTGRYYVTIAPGSYTKDVEYYVTWSSKFTGGTLQTNRNNFSMATAVQANDLGRVALNVRNGRRFLAVRND